MTQLQAKPEKIKYFTPAKIREKTFTVLEFSGDFYNLLGKPGQNFTMIVHGKPRGGKSTLIIKFSDYLALNFGKVLYISAEELMGVTMQTKIEKCQVKSENIKFVPTRELSVAERAVKNSRAHFVVIDSAQKLGFTKENLYAWQKRFKNKAFIIILQSDKSGNYKGDTAWGHDTDIRVKVEEGFATADSRFDPPTSTMLVFQKHNKQDLFTTQNN